MPVEYGRESAHAKEMAKWEAFPTDLVSKPGRPYVYQPYPKMLYRALKWTDGKPHCLAPPLPAFGWTSGEALARAQSDAEAFTNACQMTVRDETEHRLAKGQGWSDHPHEAMELYEKEQQALGNAAAEAIAASKRMTGKAEAEFQAVQDATHEHVADVAAPKRSPGRPKAVATE